MVTMKDIARIAGVSQGTVSNVLNGRGNVSVEKILLVQEVAKKLGYVSNAQAKQLRKDAKLTSNIAIILPNIEDDIYISFFNSAKRVLEENGYNVLLFITNNSPYKEKQSVNHAAALRTSGVITITCCITQPDIYNPILASGGKIVHAYRKVEGTTRFVGFDFFEIGKQIGLHVLKQQYNHIGVLSGPKYYSNNFDFANGLSTIINNSSAKPPYIHFVEADWMTVLIASFDFFKDHNIPDVLVLTNEKFLPQIQLAASAGSSKPCPPIITLYKDSIITEEPNVSRYYLDYLQIGVSAAKNMIEALQSSNDGAKEICETIIPARGFRKKYSSPYRVNIKNNNITLRVLITKGQSTDALKRITPKFTRETGINVEYIEKMPQEMYLETLNVANSSKIDIVRNSMSCLSLFNNNLFYTFNDSEFRELTEGMMPSIVDDFSYIQGSKQAVPFDVGTEMLIYRKDLFEDDLLKRMFYEKTGKSLIVPSSYDEFVEIVKFFNQSWNPRSPVQAGTSVNLDSYSELSSNFILRYLNYAQDPVPKSSSKHNIDSNAIYKCIENMYNYGLYALPIYNQQWIGAPLDNFIHGKTAMEIVFLNYSSNIIHLEKNIHGGKIGYMPIPGGKSYVTGGTLSIFASSKKHDAAKEYICWVCSPRQAELFTMCGGISPHNHVYQNSEILSKYRWYEELPKIIQTAYGRNLWDAINVNKLEINSFQILKGIVQNKIDPETGSEQMSNVIKACLFK